MTKIAVIGCGLVGRAWAISFARGGMQVALWDQNEDAPKNALEYIADILRELAANDLLNGATPTDVLGRINIADSLADALNGAIYIQENTPEMLDVKRAVFAELDALADPNAIIASSTSAILPSAFSEGLKGRHRCLVAHPLNPPYLIPAVELAPAPWTSEETLATTKSILEAADHAVITMRRELDGFVMNRLQGALLEEAFRLVDRGYASTEDVDVALREGLALRWSFMGPFETIDLNAPAGVREYVERYQGIYVPIFEQSDWRSDWAGPVLETVEKERREKLAAKDLLARQIWRDKQLIALMAHKKQTKKDLGE